jgi:hypothetical protein
MSRVYFDIETANEHWLVRQESSLRDVALLLTEKDERSAHRIAAFIHHVECIGGVEKTELLKHPMFQRAMKRLTDDVLGLFVGVDDHIAPQDRLDAVRDSVTALCNTIAPDGPLASLPQIKWIRIATGSAIELFVAGSEYGVELDDDVDVIEWSNVASRALELIALDPDNDKLVRTFVSYIVPLRQREKIQNLSFSSRDFPNVIFKNNEVYPVRFGETLVHEADHQFFYALEECHTFWMTNPQSHAAVHFSPWRDDPRPLDGILRGLSAFTRVLKFYSATLRRANGGDAETLGNMLAQRLIECQNAAATLMESGELSPAGESYVQELVTVLDGSESEFSGLEAFSRWKSGAVNSLRLHVDRCRAVRDDGLSTVSPDYL